LLDILVQGCIYTSWTLFGYAVAYEPVSGQRVQTSAKAVHSKHMPVNTSHRANENAIRNILLSLLLVVVVVAVGQGHFLQVDKPTNKPRREHNSFSKYNNEC